MRRRSGRTTTLMVGPDRKLALQGDKARVDDTSPGVIPPEHRELVLRGLEEARNGLLATEEEVRANFDRFRL